jgi:hypothetical protein
MKPSGIVLRTTKRGGKRSVYMQRGYADVVPIFIQGIWTTTYTIQLFCIGSSPPKKKSFSYENAMVCTGLIILLG